MYLKVHMPEFVYTSEQEIAIMRYVGIQEFTCFHPISTRFTRNHHFYVFRRKVYVLGGICWVFGQGGQNQ